MERRYTGGSTGCVLSGGSGRRRDGSDHDPGDQARELAGGAAVGVHPEQQRFVADSAPIAAIMLAKAYVGAGGLRWRPYALYIEGRMVGLLALATGPEEADRVWLRHFFIDHTERGSGYGPLALQRLIALVTRRYPRCQMLCSRCFQRMWVPRGLHPPGVPTDGRGTGRGACLCAGDPGVGVRRAGTKRTPAPWCRGICSG